MSAVVTVTILGDDASLQAALASGEASLATFGKAAKTAGDNMQSVGRTLTHGITVPVIAAGAAATKMAYDFQQNVQKVINLSTNFNQTQAQVSKTVLDTSTATGQSANDLAGAYYKIAAAGYPAAQAQQILAEGAKMAAVGMGTATDTTDALLSVINVYGAANMSAAKAGDIFTATIQNSKFAAADLAPVLGRVLPVAGQLGVSFQDLGGDLAALSHVGLSADSSVTGLTALFSNLIAATKQTGNAQKEMKALGLSAKGLLQDLGTKGSIATLDEIKSKLVAAGGAAQYTTAQWQDLATNMGMSLDAVKAQFGQIDLGKLQMLFPNKKAFLTFLGLTDENNLAAQAAAKSVGSNVTGDLEKIFGQWSSSDAGKMTMAINSVKNALIEVGDKLLPKVADAINSVVGWWDKLSTSQKDNAEHWALVAAEIGPVLLVMGKLTSAVGALSKVAEGNKFFLLGAAFAMLYMNSTDFRNIVNQLLGPLATLASHADLVKGALYGISTYLVVSKFTAYFGALAAWVTKLYAVRDAEVAVTAEAGLMDAAMAGPLALAAGAAVVSFVAVKGALDYLDPPMKNASKLATDLTHQLQPMAQALRDTQGPITGADTDLQHIATTLAQNALNMKGSGDAAVNLGKMLTQNLGLNAEQAKQALEDMGFSAQDAQTILNGFSSASIDGQLQNIVSNANAASAALAATQAAQQAAGVGGGGIGTAGWAQDASSITAALTANNDPSTNGTLAAMQAAPTGSGGSGGSGGGGSSGSAAAAKAAAKKAATAAKLAAAEALASTNGAPLLNLESWLMGGLQNTGKDGPVTKAAKALAADIKKNYTVKGGTVPQAAQDAQAALANLAQQASSFNTTFQSKLTSGADFVSVFKGTGAGAGDIKAYLTQQVAGITRLGNDLKVLKARGVPANILQMLATAGVDGVDQADSLVNANSTDLASIIGLGNTITSLSQSIANNTESAIFSPPTALTAALANGSTSTTKKNAKGHNITVTVNNADAKKIAKTIAQTLANTS